ncbi:VOC family protein [Micromonospora sp. M12]
MAALLGVGYLTSAVLLRRRRRSPADPGDHLTGDGRERRPSAAGTRKTRPPNARRFSMAIRRMDNVLIVVDDLDAVIAFFVELGMELEEGPVEGRWVERVIGIDDVQQEVAMLRTPDGHGKVELAMFHAPTAISAEPKDAPANTLGIRRIMFAVDDVEDTIARLRATGPSWSGSWSSTRTSIGSATCAARRASSSDWPRNCAEDNHGSNFRDVGPPGRRRPQDP